MPQAWIRWPNCKKSAEDCAIIFDEMKGFDHNDSTSNHEIIFEKTEFNFKKENVKKINIGVPKEYFLEYLDQDVTNSIYQAIEKFKDIGFNIKEVSLPDHEYAIPAYYIIASAEASSNLSRYDGIKFGYRCENPTDLQDLYFRTRKEGFGMEVKKRIMIGTYALSSGYYDEYYMRALRIRRIIRDNFNEAFKEVDFILSPTSPSTAFNIGEKTANAVEMYLSDVYTTPVNLAGLPAVSIPTGFANKLPVGIQIIGNYFTESKILDVANLYQKKQIGIILYQRNLTMSNWESVIGLEIHVQLLTKSKIFSSSSTKYGATPNQQASYVDLGMPGTLPILNELVIKKAVEFGLAINGRIANKSIFARKNYFYPDLPKKLPDKPVGSTNS